ncbi:Molybdopterin adenylyltransferase [Phycisphaerae bacterium RAS1]|nr:Molybdopterin adenylyltransferase [Phycisphaerae bacterium RAS1]
MPNRAVVITISDRCSAGLAEDRSGPAIIEALPDLDASLVHREIVPDEVARIRGLASAWIGRCELILSTGGTGVSPRDVTPEALTPLVAQDLPGFGEAMRMRAFESKPTSILSRGGAGVAAGSLIVWMPGSPRAVRECLQWLTPAIREACQLLRGQSPH